MFGSNWKSALLLNIHDKSNLHFILLFKKLSIRSSHLFGVLFNGDDWNWNKIRAWWTYWRRCRNWMTVGDTFLIHSKVAVELFTNFMV